MAQFKYTISKMGKEDSGILEAANVEEAGERLQEQGGYILELTERFSWGSLKLNRWLEKISMPLMLRMDEADKILFTNQLGSMLKTGLPVGKAIEAFIDEGHTKSSVIFRRVLEQLGAGKSLSEALEEYPKIFDKIYVNVLKSGEATGKMADSLVYLGEQMKREHKLKAKVKAALMYPIVVLMAMAGVMSFITISVIPKIVSFAKNAGAQLPQITQIIIKITNVMTEYWWLMLIGVLGILVGGWRLVNTARGRRLVDKMLLNLPVIGKLIRRYNQARFSRLLSGFYRYGISVKVGFKILSETLSNYYYCRACVRMREKIMLGRSLSAVLISEEDLFSGIMKRVVKGAEQTGGVDETLSKLASFYEEELENSLNNLTTIIEPILIVFLGLGVIGIALAVIVPIYRVTSQLR